MFLGRDSVLRARDRARDHFGKLTSGTLSPSDGSTAVAYANVYIAPVQSQTAIGGEGTPNATATGYFFQLGESDIPRVDDTFEDADGNDWQILSVVTRLNADPGYAVHDVTLVRVTAP